MRRRPRPSERPPAPGVVAQQERMASVAILYRCLKAVGLYAYWQRAAKGSAMSGYNLLMRENLPAFDADGTIRDFTKLRLSPDLLPLPDNLTLAPTDDGAWRLAWEVSSMLPGAREDDRLLLFAMCDKSSFDLHPVDADGARRGDGGAVFRLPDSLPGCGHVFVTFCSRAMVKCTSSITLSLKSK